MFPFSSQLSYLTFYLTTLRPLVQPWQVSAAGVAFGFLLVLCIACIVISFALSNQAMENYLTEVILLEDLGIIMSAMTLTFPRVFVFFFGKCSLFRVAEAVVNFFLRSCDVV